MKKAILALLVTFITGTVGLADIQFGYNGQHGRNGRDGTNGIDGPSISVRANGQIENFTINGSDGGHGYHGSNGEDATRCWHNQPTYNVYGAQGGNGGSGGDGGRGGNGGDITVFTNDINHLSKIYVDSTPGRGGRGGIFGREGEGCRCRDRYWTKRVCRQVKQPDGKTKEVCQDVQFQCRDGRRGDSGRPGRPGSEGRMGTLILVEGANQIPQEVRVKRIAFHEMESVTHQLIVNEWQRNSNAGALLRPGSRIADTYLTLLGSKSFYFNFDWNVERELADFNQSQIKITANNKGVQFQVDSNIWYAGQNTLSNGVPGFEFQKAVFVDEVDKLELSLSGGANSLSANIKDIKNVTHLLETRIHAKLKADRLFNKTLFKGELPDSILEFSKEGINVDLTELKIDPKYLEPGKRLILELEVTRRIGLNEKVIKLKQKYKIQ